MFHTDSYQENFQGRSESNILAYTGCPLNAYKASGRTFPSWMPKANLQKKVSFLFRVIGAFKTIVHKILMEDLS